MANQLKPEVAWPHLCEVGIKIRLDEESYRWAGWKTTVFKKREQAFVDCATARAALEHHIDFCNECTRPDPPRRDSRAAEAAGTAVYVPPEVRNHPTIARALRALRGRVTEVVTIKPKRRRDEDMDPVVGVRRSRRDRTGDRGQPLKPQRRSHADADGDPRRAKPARRRR